MTNPARSDAGAFSDITATEFKKHFGQTLDRALRGTAVRITRHGRASDRLVLLREEDLERLSGAAPSPLDQLRARFDTLLARMQTAEAREAAMSVGTADTDAISEAAAKGFRTSD